MLKLLIIVLSYYSVFCSETAGQTNKLESTENGLQLLKNEIEYIYELSHSSFHRILLRTHIPFARPVQDNETEKEKCLDSADEFPPMFDEEQLRNGAVVLCFLIGIYCFTLLAVVCDGYFLPCMERICEAFDLSHDVAAATFMAIATSAPELFVNIIGTFLTQSDLGLGTVVGSSLFNTLGVASLGGLAASAPISIKSWPLTRDVAIYICAVALLVTLAWDGRIFWYEGLILVITLVIYFTIMFQNDRISKIIRRTTKHSITKEEGNEIVIKTTLPLEELTKEHLSQQQKCQKEEEDQYSFTKMPRGFWKKIFYVYTYPINLLLFCTVPDPQKHPRLYPLTFIMCILWIGSNSYLVSWMITLIGVVLGIPDSVLGLTFLAAGGCLPESFSLIIMSRRGEGSMGVSNALGANTMNILLSLGMPWFIKTLIMDTDSSAYIQIESGSLAYTILALIVVALILYVAIVINRFRLSRKLGVALLFIYLCCLSLAILSEMVFFNEEGCLG